MTHRALKPVDLHVLLALVEGPLHGYALARQLETESEGRVRLLPGNLYAILNRFAADGLIRQAAPEPRPAGDGRRRYFELTDKGREQLTREARRLDRLLASVRVRQLLRSGEEVES